jgi:hypothetical protein
MTAATIKELLPAPRHITKVIKEREWKDLDAEINPFYEEDLRYMMENMPEPIS